MTMDTGKHLVLGNGMGLLAVKNPATGLYSQYNRIGNITVLATSADIERLLHYNAENAGNFEDASFNIKTTPMLKITTDEMSPENIAYGDFATSETVTQAAADNNTQVFSNVTPGCYLPFDKKYIGIQTLAYDGGTSIFTVGLVVTGAGGGTGVVVQVIGDATSGVLYLKDRNATAFVDDESITDSGTGAADANGAEAFLSTAVSLEDADAPGTFLVAGTDFTVDSSMHGSIHILDGVTATNLNAVYANAQGVLHKINSFTQPDIEVKFWFKSDNTAGMQFSFVTRGGKWQPTGESSAIGSEFKTLEFEHKIYADYVNFPLSPFMERVIYDTV